MSLSSQLLQGFGSESLQNLEVGEDLSDSLKFDDVEYLPLNGFSSAVDALINKRGRLRQPKHTPIKNLCVNGVVRHNEPMVDYLNAKGISSSLVKQAHISPRHYYIAKNMPIKPKNTKHFEIGTFAHSAILEPNKFNKVQIEPKANRATTAGLNLLVGFYSDFLEGDAPDVSGLKIDALRSVVDALRLDCEDQGYIFIKEDDFTLVNIMRQTCITYGNGIVPMLMKYAKKEVSMYGVDPQSGLDVKIRPDAILLEEDFGANIIVSVKTTKELNPSAFMRDAAKLKYEISEGMYLDVASNVTGRKFSGCIMIVMQTSAPYQMFVGWWDAEDLEVGKIKYFNALESIRVCQEKDHYPGFESLAEQGDHGIIQFKLPEYIKYDIPTKTELE